MRAILLMGIILFWGAVIPATAQIPTDNLYAFENRSLNLNVFATAGWNHFNIGNLNTRLRDAGYQSFSKDFLSLGGGVDIHVHRVVLAAEGSVFMTGDRSSRNGTISTSLAGGSGLIQAGYDLFPFSDFQLFPLVGVGFGAMRLSLEPLTSANFSDVLTDPRRIASMTAHAALVNVGIGGEIPLPLLRRDGSSAGILLGFRAGYQFSPFSTNWRLSSTRLAGGPGLDLSGPYFKVLLGGGIWYRSGGFEY